MDEKKNIAFLEERKRLTVTGVISVIRFEEKEAEISTELGTLLLTGDGLHLDGLDAEGGKVILSGLIRSLYWPDEHGSKEKKGLFRGLFS